MRKDNFYVWHVLSLPVLLINNCAGTTEKLESIIVLKIIVKPWTNHKILNEFKEDNNEQYMDEETNLNELITCL